MKIDKAADNDEVLIVFDSWYGNTQAIAKAVAQGMGDTKKIQLVKVEQIQDIVLSKYTLIIVGTPVQGGGDLRKRYRLG